MYGKESLARVVRCLQTLEEKAALPIYWAIVISRYHGGYVQQMTIKDKPYRICCT